MVLVAIYRIIPRYYRIHGNKVRLVYEIIYKLERLFLAVPRGCLQFVIVVFSDHTHLFFLPYSVSYYLNCK